MRVLPQWNDPEKQTQAQAHVYLTDKFVCVTYAVVLNHDMWVLVNFDCFSMNCISISMYMYIILYYDFALLAVHNSAVSIIIHSFSGKTRSHKQT